MRIVDYAIIPAHRAGPSLVKNTAMGILIGGFLAAAVVVVNFLLNDKSKEMIQCADDLKEMYPDIQVLSMIPDMRQSDKKNSYYSDYYGPVKSKQKGGADNGRKQGA